MRTARRHLARVALGVGVAASIATSEGDDGIRCLTGHHPYDGATAVPLDTTVVLGTYSIDREAPAFTDEVIRIERTSDGALVESELVVDLEHEQVLLTPLQPLEPDETYQIVGLDYGAQEGPHQQSWDNTPERSTFSTASDPGLLAAWWVDDGGVDRIALVLSQAVDLSTLDADSLVLPEGVSEDLVLEVPEPMAGGLHLLEARVAAGDASSLVEESIGLAASVLAEDGGAFDEATVEVARIMEDPTPIYDAIYSCLQFSEGEY